MNSLLIISLFLSIVVVVSSAPVADTYLVDTWTVPGSITAITIKSNGTFTAVLNNLPANGNLDVDMTQCPFWINFHVTSFGITLPGIYAHGTSASGLKEFILALPTDQTAIFSGTAQRPTSLSSSASTFISPPPPPKLTGQDSYLLDTWVLGDNVSSFTFKNDGTFTGSSASGSLIGTWGVDQTKTPFWIDLYAVEPNGMMFTIPGVYGHATGSSGEKEFLLAIPSDQGAMMSGTATRPSSLTLAVTFKEQGQCPPTMSCTDCNNLCNSTFKKSADKNNCSKAFCARFC